MYFIILNSVYLHKLHGSLNSLIKNDIIGFVETTSAFIL